MQFLEVDNATVTPYLCNIYELFKQSNWASTSDKLAEILSLRGSFAVVAKNEFGVIGFGFCVCYYRHAWTGYIIVDKLWRRQGIASAIKKTIITRCKSCGIDNIRLITRKDLIKLNANLEFNVELELSTYQKTISVGDVTPYISDKYIQEVINFDSNVFMGDRSDRITKHICEKNGSWVAADKNRVRGYAFAWELDNFTRIGPVLIPDGLEARLFSEFVNKVRSPNKPLQILINNDDIKMAKQAICSGFSLSNSWVQMCASLGNKRRRSPNPLIRSIWGRATG